MPPKAADREGKRHPLSFRATLEMREALERVASSAGRSLTQEIEHRLERSFSEESVLEQVFGGSDAVAMLSEIGAVIPMAQRYARSKGYNRDQTRQLVRQLLNEKADDLYGPLAQPERTSHSGREAGEHSRPMTIQEAGRGLADAAIFADNWPDE